MALMDELKTVLRVKSSAFDEDEIKPLINACKIDLKLSGVNKIDETDPMVKQAVKLYVKANFGFADDSEKFRAAYEALKNSMALSGEYGGAVVAVPRNG